MSNVIYLLSTNWVSIEQYKQFLKKEQIKTYTIVVGPHLHGRPLGHGRGRPNNVPSSSREVETTQQYRLPIFISSVQYSGHSISSPPLVQLVPT